MVADSATFSGLCYQEGHWPAASGAQAAIFMKTRNRQTDRRAPPQMVTESLQL